MVILNLKSIESGYRTGKTVLHGVDLQLECGDFVGLLGPNGCGKSTLIRTITGIIPLTSGQVVLDGKTLQSLTRREVASLAAVVPQDGSGRFAFSVREVVMMGRHAHYGRFRRPTHEDEAAVAVAMEQTQTVHLADRSIVELSGGERQRVIIARALAQTPRVMLLDEPTNHLDINHQVEVFDLLNSLNIREGLTLLCVTHDLNFAAEYCSKVVLMKEGRIFAQGRPTEVVTREIVSQVFGIRVQVSSVDGTPRVTPVYKKGGGVAAVEERTGAV